MDVQPMKKEGTADAQVARAADVITRVAMATGSGTEQL
jgi:hypothetical protein